MDAGAQATPYEPWWPLVAIGIVGVFVLAGPPIGAVATWLAVHLASPVGFRANALPMLLLSVMYSYWIGAPFAFASGALHAVAALRFGWYSAAVPLIISIAVTVAGAAVLAWLRPSHAGLLSDLVGWILLYGPACAVGTFCCWGLTRKLARRS